jgi:hypothetical protein
MHRFEIEHLLALIFILYFKNHGSDIFMTLFNLLTAKFMLLDRTVTFVSASYT